MIEVVEEGTPLRFSYDDMLRYSGPGSPAGVAMAYQAMRLAFPVLDPGAALDRREVTIETAFRGPGARDAFELATRALTDGRYLVTATLERPERGTTLEQFVFRFSYRGRNASLLVRYGLVTDEFVALARRDDRTASDEQHFTDLKQALAATVLGRSPGDLFELED